MSRTRTRQTQMFTTGQDMPLFSGTAPTAQVTAFKPIPQGQPRLPCMPVVSWEELAARKQASQTAAWLDDDDPDEEAAAPANGQPLTAGQLAQVMYQNTCPLSCVGLTEHCHNCALFVTACRTPHGLTIECKGHQYADDDGQLLPGYGLLPGQLKHDTWKTRIQWVKEVYLAQPTVKERPARFIAYNA